METIKAVKAIARNFNLSNKTNHKLNVKNLKVKK